MNSLSIGGSSLTGSIDSLSSLLQSDQNGTTDAAATSSGTPAASTDLSDPAKLFSKLQALSKSDPAKFKQVTAEFADKLKTLAAKEGGQKGEFLTKLADKFTEASQTGDAGGLEPPKPPAGGPQAAYAANGAQSQHSGGHHKHGGQQDSDLSTLFDQLSQELDSTS